MELVLKRLDLEDILVSEQEFLGGIADLPTENCDTDPFAFQNRLGDQTHVAQTQRILANIQQRKNMETTRLLENEEDNPGSSGSKRKRKNPHNSKATKKVRLSKENSHNNSDEGSSGENENNNCDDHMKELHSEFQASMENSPPKNETIEELPSILGSPVITSTLKPKPSSEKLSIFQFAQDEESDDDTIFDL